MLPIFNAIDSNRNVLLPIDRVEFLGRMKACPKVDVTNCFKVAPDCGKLLELPICVPPWKECWLEWSDGGINGALCCFLCTEKDEPDCIKHYQAGFPGLKYMAQTAMWFDLKNGTGVRACLYAANIFFNGDGRGIGVSIFPAYGVDPPDPDEAMHRAVFYQLAYAPCFAFSIANCRNVSLIENNGVNQRHRKGKKPSKFKYIYYTLNIGVGKTKSAESRDVEDDPATEPKAIHLCRGHFAEYTPEKPLFGKYTGLFYKPQHIRGKITSGIVEKDYSIS